MTDRNKPAFGPLFLGCVVGILGLILTHLAGCQSNKHVQMCVTRCEALKHGCQMDHTTYWEGIRYCNCKCVFEFVRNDEMWVDDK